MSAKRDPKYGTIDDDFSDVGTTTIDNFTASEHARGSARSPVTNAWYPSDVVQVVEDPFDHDDLEGEREARVDPEDPNAYRPDRDYDPENPIYSGRIIF